MKTAGPHGYAIRRAARAAQTIRRRGAFRRRRARGWLSAKRVWFENASDAKICCAFGLAQQRGGSSNATPWRRDRTNCALAGPLVPPMWPNYLFTII
jgi:hypothetical protein